MNYIDIQSEYRARYYLRRTLFRLYVLYSFGSLLFAVWEYV
jgi:hypothetical protein